MVKAVIFDMDGVIVDTEPLHKKAYHKMFSAFNLEVTNSMYQGFTGQSTLSICNTLCNHFNLLTPPETLVQSKRDFFSELFFNDESLQLIPGVFELIKDYHKNGIKLVLASSASMFTITNVFNRFNLNPYFIARFSGADLKASKPHPEIFEKAAAATGFNKSDCIVIEDSTNGIKAAYNANIFCVAYKSEHSKNQDYSLASLVIDEYSEISFNKIIALNKN